MMTTEKLGLIAGNGRFPFLLLDAARAHGLVVVVAAIKEETDPAMNDRAKADTNVRVHWMSLGELSRLIETFQAEGVTRAVMAGQVKHKQIFSSIRPDWRLAKLLLNLRTRSTDVLLGAVAKVLGDEGIELISSTQFLEPLLAKAGVLTKREPDEEERKDIDGLWRALLQATIWARRWSSPHRPAWRWRRWRAPMPQLSGPALCFAHSKLKTPCVNTQPTARLCVGPQLCRGR
jgi:DUF1009 family protein